ncbi:unnamed protein product, partial [marine sediment metagenome]
NKIKNNKVLPGHELEADPEIIKLKKEAIKEKLKREIRELKEPFETKEELAGMQGRLNGFFEHMKTLTMKLNGMLVATDKWECADCGTKGKVCINLRCSKCEHTSWWGWQV